MQMLRFQDSFFRYLVTDGNDIFLSQIIIDNEVASVRLADG